MRNSQVQLLLLINVCKIQLIMKLVGNIRVPYFRQAYPCCMRWNLFWNKGALKGSVTKMLAGCNSAHKYRAKRKLYQMLEYEFLASLDSMKSEEGLMRKEVRSKVVSYKLLKS